jgi:predicted small metal-binding protein
MQVGDKVVYIADSKFIHLLNKHGIYTISEICKDKLNKIPLIFYKFEECGKTAFNSKYFISLIEHRKTQIEKIKNRINEG